MRRRAISIALAAWVLLASAGTLHAHPGHGAELSREQVIERGTREIERLASQGKLEKSWTTAARLKSADVAERSGQPEWVLIYENRTAQAPQDTLYVFLSVTGEYLAANFTGR